jgi:hypothetical protein
MRQHLQIDAGLVHFLQAQFAKIVEALHGCRRRDRVQTAGMPLHLGIVVMLLQGDDVGFGSHSSSSMVNGHCGIRSTGLSAAPPTASAAA